MKKIICLLLASFVFSISFAQINIGKRVERKVINRTNTRIDQGIDKGLDAIEDGIKGDNKDKNQDKPKEARDEKNKTQDEKEVKDDKTAKTDNPALMSYSKYDFVPGEKVIFYDDFSSDNVGDFPAAWNTDGSAEVMTTNLFPGKWMKITSDRCAVSPYDPLDLPENFTVEFDVIPQKSQGGNSKFRFGLISTTKPKDLKYGLAIPGENGIRFSFDYESKIYYNTWFKDDAIPDMSGMKDGLKFPADKKYRVSMWVQKERVRLYLDDQKVYDLPRALSKGIKYNMIRFDSGTPLFTNLRVAVGAPDMRNKLLTEGKLVTYGIYFDVNKDVVKPESYGTLKSIADVLTENPDVKVKILGHTDADGADAANLDLSKRRAASVKNELVKNFNIDASRFETDGMGETQPVAANDTPSNKALNRRVEFIKL
ncbi:MAG TPA: OmpA family protein [Lentimicrobium sp.]|nr:OmpA family protein [Lentimicrobium sp.]